MEAIKELRLHRPVSYEEAPLPGNVMIGLTSTCNHRCVFCPHDKYLRPAVVMEKDLMVRIIHECYELGVREIGFYLDNEPFMSRYFEDGVKVAHDLGYSYIYATTNGAMATAKRMRQLFLNGLNSIKFSVNAGNRETYFKTHGRDDFDRVIQNILDADAIRKELNMDIGFFLSFIGYNANQGQFEGLKEMLGAHIDQYYYIQGSDTLFTEEESARMGLERVRISKCDMVFNRIHVTAEGLVSACCGDFPLKLIVGDAKEQSISEIWYGEPFRQIRRWHLEQKFPEDCECYNCFFGTRNDTKPFIWQQR